MTKSPFFNRVANGFLTGFDAVVSVLDGLVIAISFLFPFAVVVGPIGYVAYRINKKRKSKKEEKKPE